MRRLSIVVLLVALVSVAAPSTSSAQQSLNFYIGGFNAKGEDARDLDDVLRNNLNFLTFDINDFNSFTGGAEYLVGMGEFLEAGLGVGIYSSTVPSFYSYQNENGFSIDQELKLRVVPFTATVRFLPLGRTGGIEPYIGGGVAILNYRYSEVGDFVFDDGSIDHGSFVGSGTATGPLVVGGVRFPVGPLAVGGEVRYQHAHGDLPLDQDFSGSTIDLGGWTYAATFKVRF
jgi:hypothetical protein